MATISSSTPNVVPSVVSVAKAEVTAVESKVVTFVKAHAGTAIGAVVGFGTAKLGILGLIWKLI